MTWSNATRVLIHIGDAPPHGRRFHTYSHDSYPDGDPNGLTAESKFERHILFATKKLKINPHEPDWTTHPEKTGKLLYYTPPKTLSEVKDEYYFINSKFIEQDISFKVAQQPFSIGAERFAYFALDTSLEQANKLVIKEYQTLK
ncbi:kinase-like protein [Gigaspora margarita]|uniref:Kinase-like protein n=1 Tax=Gigaspora margarita TaxID=4874 RepID=A0A8H4AK15_GIGMA|nr:kinase-like protein [Gigaspora margarita]